jgi:RNA polymerase sigma factor (sigma-70 family)
MKDSLIINELRNGNTKVFSLIYNSYPLIENYILKNNGSKDDAKDIFQNALIVFYQKAKAPEFELTAKLSTYLFAICKNNWLKVLRKKKSTSELNEETHQISIEEQHQVNETRIINTIQEKLKELGDPCKSLIVFHEFHKMKWEIIAKKMNYATAHAARNQKYKCLLRLKKMIPEQLKNSLLNR